MYVPEGEIGFRVYWEDKAGTKQELFTSGLDKEQVVAEAIDYIRNRIYMDSFTIVGLEQLGKRGWEKVEIKRTWCKGRA
ncbi:hypothetical protein CVD28_02565 [Bacillus sp. M6-12]|uniref:hypothetical protein n=1 Tax=Bacillus sp. M6-12 TaxID=2054166 RepID=UPI000C7927D2|nr:hypothetical protein [Bacillus sp. M6-12]PLS19315.1 hypothetical protein CVD28_02565 [Bacillus sp. M6-12]